MVADLFVTQDMPEPPKESFFKGLFGGGARSLDREELCMYLITNIPGGTLIFNPLVSYLLSLC